VEAGNTKGGSITVPLTSGLTGLESAVTTDNFCVYLQNRLIQTSQTGGQWYSDTSPFSIPWWKGLTATDTPICKTLRQYLQ
jgi:hypothetical protein